MLVKVALPVLKSKHIISSHGLKIISNPKFRNTEGRCKLYQKQDRKMKNFRVEKKLHLVIFAWPLICSAPYSRVPNKRGGVPNKRGVKIFLKIIENF